MFIIGCTLVIAVVIIIGLRKAANETMKELEDLGYNPRSLGDY